MRISEGGTIEVKSASLFSGYSGLDPSVCDMRDDGWLDTGDLGALDADGYLYVYGRKKNVLCLPNGRNVFPEQVESDLRKFHGVRDAVVFLDQVDGLVALIISEPNLDRGSLEVWSQSQFSDIERPSHLWLIPFDDSSLSTFYTVTDRPKRTEIANLYLQRNAQTQIAKDAIR
ncbi:2-succinylbenzoate--CoA ligase [compost metagenome]